MIRVPPGVFGNVSGGTRGRCEFAVISKQDSAQGSQEKIKM